MDSAITGRDIPFDVVQECTSYRIIFEDMSAQVYDMKKAQDVYLKETQRIERAVQKLVQKKNALLTSIDILAARYNVNPMDVLKGQI